MQLNSSRRRLPLVIGLALAFPAIAAHAQTGVHVVLQAWSPLKPDQPNVVTLVDQPSLVSDSLQDAWTRARPRICEQLKLKMGVGGIAHGQTLRDINCGLDPSVVLEIVPAGQNALRATFAVRGFVEATSTTPTVLGSYADPRFSLALTARLELILAVQPSREQTLRVSKAQFTLNKATLDSHNFSGDVLKFVADDLVPFFGGPDYKSLAENAVNAISVDFTDDFDAALVPVNAQLKGPSDAVRVGVSATTHYINVAFAPGEFTPPTDGSVTGVLRWNPSQFTPRNGCQSFDIHDTVQTAPVPLYTANASPTMREVGTFQASAVDSASCAFVLSGIPAGWPNVLAARVVNGARGTGAGSTLYSVTYTLVGEGWDGRNVTPQSVANARDYRVSPRYEATATEAPGHAVLQKGYRTDPRINPADIYSDPASAAQIKTNPVSQRSGTVSLNPQPLPPGPDAALQTPAIRTGAALQRQKPKATKAATGTDVVQPQPVR